MQGAWHWAGPHIRPGVQGDSHIPITLSPDSFIMFLSCDVILIELNPKISKDISLYVLVISYDSHLSQVLGLRTPLPPPSPRQTAGPLGLTMLCESSQVSVLAKILKVARLRPALQLTFSLH